MQKDHVRALSQLFFSSNTLRKPEKRKININPLLLHMRFFVLKQASKVRKTGCGVNTVESRNFGFGGPNSEAMWYPQYIKTYACIYGETHFFYFNFWHMQYVSNIIGGCGESPVP